MHDHDIVDMVLIIIVKVFIIIIIIIDRDVSLHIYPADHTS